jgi:hypothetical protein
MPITIKGNPPHDLPFAESASAEAVNPKHEASVELTLNVIIEGNPRPVPVRVRMAAETARGLSDAVLRTFAAMSQKGSSALSSFGSAVTEGGGDRGA